MGRRKSKVKFSKSNKGNQEDLPVETGVAEIDVSKSVKGDASENNMLSQSEYEGRTVEETENNNNMALVDCSLVDKNTVDAAEDENIHQEHAAEEVDMGLVEAKEEEERPDDNSDDVSDNDDNYNDFDEADEEIDDYDDIEDNVEFNDDDDVEDDNNEEEEEDDGDYGNKEDDSEEDDGDYGNKEDDSEEDDGDYGNKEDDSEEDDGDYGNKEDDSEEDDGDYDNKEDDGDYDKEEEENDFLMEVGEIYEITKLENKDDALKEGDESQRNGAIEGENAKEENEERGDGSLNKKEKSSLKVKERKKITSEVLDKVASKHNKRQEKNDQDDAMKEADQGNAKEDIQDKEGTSKQKIKKLRKSRKVTAGGSEKVVSKQDDKLESSSRKKVKSMGMIFMCSSKTKKDCYHYKVLGLPANKKELVGQIYKGMRLFLYDVDLKLLYGIYKAAGRGGYNIQPKAFNSQFPSQVRFTVLDDCLPLAEEKFKKVIRDNYFTKKKFDCQLTSQQVRNLCKLFHSASKGSKAMMRSDTRARNRASTDKDRSRAWREERRPTMPEKRRYHEDSYSHEREVVHSAVKRRYHEDSRNHEREVLPSAVKRRYHEDSRSHEREVLPSAVKRRYYEDSRSHEREVLPSAVKRRYYEDSRNHEREGVASAVTPMPVRLVPATVAPPSYMYDRTSELDSYRRDWLVEPHDSRAHLVPEPRLDYPIIYRRDPLLHQLDPYRRDSTTEHLDLRLRDEIGRHDPYISYRERLEHQVLSSRDDFARRRDPYISYRRSTEDDNLRLQDELRRQDPYIPSERPAYRDHVYATHQLRETDRYLPANRTDYSSAVASLPEFRSVRSFYRY